MPIGSPDPSKSVRIPLKQKCEGTSRLLVRALFAASFLLFTLPPCAGQAGPPEPDPPLPETAQPLLPAHLKIPVAEPCQIKRSAVAMVEGGAAGAMASNSASPVLSPNLHPETCPPLAPLIDWYARFLNGPQVRRMTPQQKAWLATRNLIDPFNAITILGSSAIFVPPTPTPITARE